MQSSKPLVAVCVCIAMIAGCSITPMPLSTAEIDQRIQLDRQAMFSTQPPVTAPITFTEALGRAYLFNLENRLKAMEDALAQGQLDLAYYDMLPRLTALAGYSNRDNDGGGTAINLRTGVSTTDPTVAEERTHHTEQLALSWNLLDLGLSYVTQVATYHHHQNPTKRKWLNVAL